MSWEYGRSDPIHVQGWCAAMEPAELAKIIFSKVQSVDPDNVCKIVGCILLREPDENEMVHLAYGSEASLHNTIREAENTLTAIYARCSASPVVGYHHQQVCSHPAAVRHFSPAADAAYSVQYWDFPPHADAAAEKEYAFVDAKTHYGLRGGDQQHALVDDHLDGGGYYFPQDAFHNGAAGPRAAAGRRSNGVSSRRPCYYFFKGVCKNGQNCRYSHHQVCSADGSFALDLHGQGGTTPGSLERLEVEITELLHSRRGQPVSIASLPTLYGEKHGKGLHADGYVTESQRYGKAGYSLTKLLSRLNKIRVIERPHGQHSVVLAEDAAKYTDCRSDRGGDLLASSHNIYLTFPPDSNFTKDDVANYFGQYGPVRDVRIPWRDQRMFGFVSFQNPETVTALLMRRNPHFICGSRVLAKAYRERTKCISERINKPTMMHYYPPRWIDSDPEFYPEYDSPTLARRQLVEMKRDKQLLELERRHFAGLHVKPQCAYFDGNIGHVVDPFTSQSAGSKEVGRMDPLDKPDPLDHIISTSQAPPIQATNNYQVQESNQIELLPESPFASSAPAGNGI